MTNAIETTNLARSFGAIQAVAGLTMSVPTGRIYGLVGPDGAGKTTTLRLLCGALRPDGGQASVMGIDVARDPEGVRRRIGYMPQRFSLYGDLTVRENLLFFADVYGVPRAEQAPLLERLLAFSRLSKFQNRRADALSGGMKQKLALACTLVHEPDVIILDEPTTGVDPVSRREFWKLLSQFLDQGITILMSTPYLDEAERCHRIALLHEGEVLALDQPGRLRGSLPGEWFEVVVDNPRDAAARLAGLAGGPRTYVFGDRLHVWLDQPRGANPRGQLDAALASIAVAPTMVRAITPSLEDVFIAKLTGTLAS